MYNNFVAGKFRRGDQVRIIQSNQLGIFLDWDNGLAQVQLADGVYFFEAYAIEYVDA